MTDNPRETLLKIFDEFKQILNKHSFKVGYLQEIPYGIQFSISQFTFSGLLRIYVNKKGVVKVDYSQINHNMFRKAIENVIGEYQVVNTEPYKSNPMIDEGIDYNPIIGIDESGKGDYFGPLVAAAVYVSKKNKELLDKQGVKDSKKLTDKKIYLLNDYIKNVCYDEFSVIEISPEKYNQLYSTLTSEGKKLNTLLAWAHAKALEEVLAKVNCNKAIADQFADERFVLSKLQERGRQIELIQQHKAETHTAVAAASILARARFLEKLQKLSEELGINLIKGASIEVINQAKKIVEDRGEQMLKKIAKLHFKTTKSVLDE